ncbi:tRNA dihydrouridine synthase DusB [Tepidamorphus sp. 3E244]|uniref:tRNA dihydrouridine synthase DusB n=1 Tax=Tepidamorphus sp. 3E244 TaxID=3385498 RepID=UPI0038FC38A0
MPVIRIGPHEIDARACLAPMSGVSDAPFRQLAVRLGAPLVVSEMVASEGLCTGNEEMQLKAQSAGCGLHVVQIAGRESVWMAEATRRLVDSGADIIDINMGCPARKVTNGYSGSALMREPDHALDLVDSTVAAAGAVPVTLKMRLGWDHGSLNAPEIARRAVDAGVQAITVHGRTRCQFYKGEADWHAVRAVRDAVDVPLTVNGDITDLDTANQALEASGADLVMVGRGSYGRPWAIGEIDKGLKGETPDAPPSRVEIGQIASEHYQDLLSHYGLRIGLRAARKHLGWYLDSAFGAGLEKRDPVYAELRRKVLTKADPKDVLRALSACLEHDEDVAKLEVAA